MPTTILDGETYEQARHRRFTEEAKVIEKIQQDEIIRMALEACAPNQTFNSDEEWVKRFAALVAAHEREKIPKDFVKACEVLVQEKIDAVLAEREACAKVCEEYDAGDDYGCGYMRTASMDCAAAIRGLK